MLLTRDEIAELTDCRRSAGQIAWLREHGWRFEVSTGGRPKVARAEFDRRMVGGKPRRPESDRPRLELVR